MSDIKSDSTMNEAMKYADNYTDWVFSSFARFLNKNAKTLEIGSGHGKYSRKLLEYSSRLYVSDIDPAAVENIKRELFGFGGVKFLVMDGIDAQKLDGGVDNIVLINVLEHIENDRGFISDCGGALNSGGKLVVFVPAFQALFSSFDAQAGHFRRYSAADVRDLLKTSGFAIEKLSYFNSVGFFGWLANKILKSQMHSKSTTRQILLYNKIIPYVKYIDRLMPFLGQSVIAVGKKEER